MTDQELLEFAAKAAGYLNWTPTTSGLHIETGSRRGSVTFYWNPLVDDGDALRLAVKLGLFVNIWLEAKQVYVDFALSKKDVLEPTEDDPYAATRRAIVRAAAEIGKEIK